MADPTPVAVVETAPIAAAPATPAPEPAQAVVTPEAQTPAPAQEAAPAPVVALVEAPKAESLLGTELDKDAPKPAPAVIVEPKKTEEGQSVEPAPPPPEAPKEPTYEPFKAPEGVTLTADRFQRSQHPIKQADDLSHGNLPGAFGKPDLAFGQLNIPARAQNRQNFGQRVSRYLLQGKQLSHRNWLGMSGKLDQG